MADDGFLQRLPHEVEGWQQEKLITQAQAKAILARYGLAEPEARRSRLALVLAFLGATLVGIGVIVFLAANWQGIPQWTKLALIFAAVAAAYHLGYWLRYQRQVYRGTGRAVLFLGALLYGAAIFLIAQGLHINAHQPGLLLLWALGVLPMAYLLRSQAMIVLAVLNLAVALGWDTAFWMLDWRDWAIVPFFSVYVIFGVLLYAIGNVHGAFPGTQQYRTAYGALGLICIFGGLLPLTFAEVLDDGLTQSGHDLPTGAVIRLAVLLALAAGAAVASLFARRRSATAFREALALGVLVLVGGSLFWLGGAPGPAGAIVLNLVLLALTVGAIAVGYLNREAAWVNLGSLFFGTQVIVRYFDWFWALLPRSVFFIGVGLVLMLGGMALERTRRRVVRQLVAAR